MICDVPNHYDKSDDCTDVGKGVAHYLMGATRVRVASEHLFDVGAKLISAPGNEPHTKEITVGDQQENPGNAAHTAIHDAQATQPSKGAQRSHLLACCREQVLSDTNRYGRIICG